MKKECLIFTMEEFDDICNRVFNGKASINNESGEWFWAMSENITNEDINKKLQLELREKIVGFVLDKVYVDLTELVVIISYFNIYGSMC